MDTRTVVACRDVERLRRGACEAVTMRTRRGVLAYEQPEW